MRFLITGASGLIGHALAFRLAEEYSLDAVQLVLPPTQLHAIEKRRHERLVQAGFDIVIHDLLEESLDIAQIKPFDILFHLAAFTETETDSSRVRTNDLGTKRLLNALAPMLPGKRVFYTGSMTSVDRSWPDNTPQAEDYPCHPRTIYGQTKLKAELIICNYAREMGFDWTIVRLPTVYGPGFRPGGMFDIFAKGLRENSLTARLAWPGRLTLIYVDDVAEALIRLAAGAVGRNDLYHMGSSDEDPEVDEVISRIATVLRIPRRRLAPPSVFWSIVRSIVWLPGLMSLLPFSLRVTLWRVSLIVTDGMVSDGTKLNNLLKLTSTPLDEGLMLTYQDYVNMIERAETELAAADNVSNSKAGYFERTSNTSG